VAFVPPLVTGDAPSFTNVTAEVGLSGRIGYRWAVGDIDGDLDAFFFVCVHQNWTLTGRNDLMLNDGAGRFTNDAASSGIGARPRVTDALATMNWNNDGVMDLFVPLYDYLDSALTCLHWRNNGNGTFTQVQDATGYNANGGSGPWRRCRAAAPRTCDAADLEVLLAREDGMPCAWAPDGKHLARWTDPDLWMATFEAGKVTRAPYLQASSNEWGPEFSPDGRWLACTSESRIGPELLFVSARLDPAEHHTGVLVAGVQSSSTLEVTKPRQLFELDQGAQGSAVGFACVPSRCCAVSPDGRRFYAAQQLPTPEPPPVTQIHLIQNGTDEWTARAGAR